MKCMALPISQNQTPNGEAENLLIEWTIELDGLFSHVYMFRQTRQT